MLLSNAITLFANELIEQSEVFFAPYFHNLL